MIETNENYSQKFTVDRFEEKFAVLRSEDNQEILWPIKKMPDETKSGNIVRLILSNNKTETEEREKIAKAVLNEILNSNEK